LKTILVVDDEKMILRLATEALKGYVEGYTVMTALNGKEAVQILNSSEVALVLTDLKMPVMDGYELLSYMSRNFRDIPVIVMTGFGSPEIAKQLKQKGVWHYIEKPFEIEVLREKVADVFAARSKGYIQGFTLANFLQAVEVEQKTITLRIRSKNKVGYMHLENGDLIEAEAGELRGEKAAIEILCWDDAEIEIQDIIKKERTIHTPLMHIILEATKIKDEKPEEEKPKDDLLSKAIQMAEGHHFKEAHGYLTKYLNANSRSPKGWLWYSRIIVTLQSIEASLNNALKLAPKDPEITEEWRRFKSVKDLVGEEQVRRCPFCWTPVPITSVQCLYCKSHLYIHNQFFTSPKDADEKILEKAIERYTRVIGREKNVNAHYYLSMAHLNLQHWEEALNLFHKTVKLAPKKKSFSDQLRVFLNHMASKKADVEKLTTREPGASESEREIADAGEKKKILVVEDSSTVRKVVSITLNQKGYEIIEAKDGLEALSRLNEETPDLILLDIILPKMDGYKILNIIKGNELFKNIPVIMLTSKDGMVSKLKGKLAGSDAYLTKPFQPKVLLETIQRYL
jgi:twitching motility two-component system response regulator PilG